MLIGLYLYGTFLLLQALKELSPIHTPTHTHTCTSGAVCASEACSRTLQSYLINSHGSSYVFRMNICIKLMQFNILHMHISTSNKMSVLCEQILHLKNFTFPQITISSLSGKAARQQVMVFKTSTNQAHHL